MKKIQLHNVTISKVRHQGFYRGNDGEPDACDLSITLTRRTITDQDQLDAWSDVLAGIHRITHLTVHYPRIDFPVEAITDYLSTWAVKNFYLRFDSLPVDLRLEEISEICEAASVSSHLSLFHVDVRAWPADLASQVPQLMLEVAMSSMQLITLEICLPMGCMAAILDLDQFSHVDELRGPVCVSALRRFLSDGSQCFTYSLDCLETRLDLVTNYLPFVYDVGLPDVETDRVNFEESERCRCLRRKLAVQLERNYVGLALCYPSIAMMIPLGLWPIVLSHAMDTTAAAKKRNGKLPLTGVFEMVRKLAERDVITSLNSKC